MHIEVTRYDKSFVRVLLGSLGGDSVRPPTTLLDPTMPKDEEYVPLSQDEVKFHQDDASSTNIQTRSRGWTRLSYLIILAQALIIGALVVFPRSPKLRCDGQVVYCTQSLTLPTSRAYTYHYIIQHRHRM